MKQPLYLAIATLLQRQRTLADSFLHSQQESSRNPRLAMKNHVEDVLTDLLKEHLPSGSGFDAGTQLEQDMCWSQGSIGGFPGRLVFFTFYHHMDEHGWYDGWTEHNVYVTPAWGGFDIKVSGINKNGIKDDIAEVFHNVLSTEVEYAPVPEGSSHENEA